MFRRPLILDEWQQISVLKQNRQLYVGDNVTAHFFTQEGEVEALQLNLNIAYNAMQTSQHWTRELASLINFHLPLVKVGKKALLGWEVGYGELPIFSHPSSGITQFELSYQCTAKAKSQSSEAHTQNIYPQQPQNYQPGTKVWHQGTGRYYKCKAWPFSESCRDISGDFEPGIGALWEMAWEEC